MKHTLLILAILCLHTISFSQIVTYAYDNSGNRTSSTVTVSKGLLTESDSSTINTEKITEQVGEQAIVVYPNPVREEVNVEITGYDENLDGSITLFDQGGRLIIQQAHLSSVNSFNLSRYAKGIYFMIIKIGTNQTKYTIIRN
jgi:hypothetical protein